MYALTLCDFDYQYFQHMPRQSRVIYQLQTCLKLNTIFLILKFNSNILKEVWCRRKYVLNYLVPANHIKSKFIDKDNTLRHKLHNINNRINKISVIRIQDFGLFSTTFQLKFLDYYYHSLNDSKFVYTRTQLSDGF